MNYEEKYKKSLEKARELMDKGYYVLMPEIFPELNESEDERIRQEIRNFIWEYPEKLPERDKWLAWFEKQGEKKPTDKVEPKFKVGNWYQCTKDFFGKGVTFDKNTAYYCAKEGCLQNEYGCHIAIVKDLYDNFKLWAIEDAKDGDVLALISGQCIFLFDGYDKEYCHYSKLTNSFSPNLNYIGFIQHQFVPATKEQRNLLFAKMREAGYEWDLDKKELKKIEVASKESEDEKIRKAIHIYLDWLDGRKDYAPKGSYSIKDMIAWLEKQKGD